MPQLLVELLSEEIPARMQAGARRDLDRMARDLLAEHQLSYALLRTFAGPRRLSLVVDDLPLAQADRVEERRGPRVGAPEAAIVGFLRSVGLPREELIERDGAWFAAIAKRGRPTPQIAAEMLEAIVREFPWPKSMTWGEGRLRWVRPLQRILCVFDREIVPLAIDGVPSGDVTEGHRFMGQVRAFRARDFDEYREGMAGHFVLLDAEERKARILGAAGEACRARSLEMVDDEALLEEVAGLAEWPTPLVGDMDPAFLTLPPEVIRTSMRNHQRYFAVRSGSTGALAPHFVVVANIEAADGGALVAAGNARVLAARLKDAQFFWDEDRRRGFGPWLERLAGVTFHARMGTMVEKVARLEFLASRIAPVVGADPGHAREAARLAKADLSSAMVGEFPELQGVMGAYYAREAGLPGPVAEAIAQQYRPLGPSDEVPEAPLSVSVALADKLDTLCGFFAIGEKPTGSRDPYGQRRAALGFIRIVLKSEVRFPIGQAVHEWYRSLKTFVAPGRAVYVSAGRTTGWLGWPPATPGDGFDAYVEELEAALTTEAVSVVAVDEDQSCAFDRAAIVPRPPTQPVIYRFRGAREVSGELTAFFVERLKVLLREQGARHDLVDAVFALGDDDLVRIVKRVQALDQFLATDDGANLLAGHKRAANILEAESKKGALPEGAPSDRPDAPAEEAALLAALRRAQAEVANALAGERYAEAMAALSGLRNPVDAFFEKVLVNSDVAAERANRLKLLGAVRSLMDQVADFSAVAG